MDRLVNTSLGPYQLLEVIGRGGTSTVYKAFQPSLGRYVAVKVLLRHLEPVFESRFRREAQAVGSLQHPNILPIYDYGQRDGMHYFVTQYVEGGVTLADTLSRGPLPPADAIHLAQLLLGALAYAHGRGIIHRDIKPSNVLLPHPDWPLLADFGIAKMLDESRQLTPPGQALGTAIYMAPERADGRPADHRSDLYSLAVMLFEMVTGSVPYDAPTPVAVLLKHLGEPVPRARDVSPGVPAALEAALLRGMAKDPGERFQSAAEMSLELGKVAAQIERERALRALMGVPEAERRREGYTTDRLDLPPDRPSPYAETDSPTLPRSAARPATPTPPRLRPERARRLDRIAAAALVALLAVSAVALAALPDAAGRSIAVGRATPGAAPTQPAPTYAAPPPTPPPDATSTPQPGEPTAEEPTAPPPTAAPLRPTAPPAPPQVTRSGAVTTLRFDDDAWTGGFRARPGQTYGGRTATWVYGTSTDYSAMQTSFDLGGQPSGLARLTVEGMDSENPAKTTISIAVNGQEIFRGRNPLPDDDQPLDTGTWDSYTWEFDSSLLRQGQNTIVIRNLDVGAFSLPPFMMLDYADLSVELR